MIVGRDRRRLEAVSVHTFERVSRYLLRPAFAHDAIQRMPDGQVRVEFKHPNRFGATYTTMSVDTFLARLCALVPPPRFNMVRYFGVLAGKHALRSHITPHTHRQPLEPKQLALFVPLGALELAVITKPLLEKQSRDAAPNRLSWMRLLARVFRIDISVCARCQGPMRIVKVVTDVDEVAARLHGARAPPRPSPPGQLQLFAR